MTAFGVKLTRAKLRRPRPVETAGTSLVSPNPQVPAVPAVTTTRTGATVPASPEVPKEGSKEGRGV